MSLCLAHLRCHRNITYRDEARKAYKEALRIAKYLVPVDPVKCLKISIHLADVVINGNGGARAEACHILSLAIDTAERFPDNYPGAHDFPETRLEAIAALEEYMEEE